MPSPLAHITMGYAIYHVYKTLRPHQETHPVGPMPRLLIVTAGLSLLPDLDVIPGFLMGDLKLFHNNLTHSPIFGLLVALLIGSIVWLRQRTGFIHWFLLSLICYEFHVLMDFFTRGRGTLLLWPFSLERIMPPVILFYGVRWGDGVISGRHLWTLMSELLFVLLVAFVIHVLSRITKLRYNKDLRQLVR